MSALSTYKHKSNKVKTIAAVGVFCAFAYVCCVLFHFKAAFLTFDLKDSVMAVGAMIFGPLYGLAMAIIVALIEMITVSTTGLYGLVMNIISSGVFVCVGSLIYGRNRNIRGAMAAEGTAVISTVAAMMIANILITPYYLTLVTGEAVSASYVADLIPSLLLPFNAVKTIFNASIVFLIYNPISTALRSAGFTRSDLSLPSSDNLPDGINASSKKSGAVTVATMIIAIVVATLTLVYFFTRLSGKFSFGV